MDTSKKISFGFNKLAKKPMVVRTQPVEEKKVELVECLEGQSIKIKDAVEIVNQPLVIPIKDNKKNLLDRVKEAKIKREQKSEKEDNKPDTELTLDEQAARALINDAKNRLENNAVSNSSKVTVLPIKEDKITIDGEEEPTLEDYDNIPISDYGMAMLRGMGWKEGMGIGKDPTKTAVTNAPELRPKGLGLGATRIVKPEEPVCDKEGNALILKRGAYAKIIAGLYKGNYCEVQGLDDEAGRVIVKTSLKGEILTLNEFLIVPVTKQEYSQGAKVLNNAKYEEYKEKSDKKLEAHRKIKKEKYSDNDSEKELNSRKKYDKNQKGPSNFGRMEQSSGSSNIDNNLSSGDEKERKSKERGSYKNKSQSDDEKEKYESRRNKYRDKHSPSSDSDKYKKSRDRYRDRSDSDTESRKKKSKDKKKKKDRHRERSRSRKEKEKREDKKSERRSRDRSSGRKSSKKHKSKSRHRRRSSSSLSDKDNRKNRK